MHCLWRVALKPWPIEAPVPIVRVAPEYFYGLFHKLMTQLEKTFSAHLQSFREGKTMTRISLVLWVSVLFWGCTSWDSCKIFLALSPQLQAIAIQRFAPWACSGVKQTEYVTNMSWVWVYLTGCTCGYSEATFYAWDLLMWIMWIKCQSHKFVLHIFLIVPQCIHEKH